MIVMDLFLALILCHNVTPIQEAVTELDDEDGDKPAEPEYRKAFNASSPDEIALVKFAEELGMILESRDEQLIQIRDATGNIHKYDILENFKFTSETKRMGIIVRNQETEDIKFYLKGAEVSMEKKVRPEQRSSLMESCEQLA